MPTDYAANWKLDENTGTTTVDSSGNGNTGTLTGLPTWTTGKNNYGLLFDSTDKVTCGTNSILNIGTGSVTFSAWIKPASTMSGNAGIIGGASGAAGILLNNMKPQITKVNAWGSTVSTATVPVGSWTHVAVTFDNASTTNNLKYYINGALVDTFSYNNSSDFTVVTNVIGSRNGSNDYFNGTIDDVCIYKRVLSASEIASLAQ